MVLLQKLTAVENSAAILLARELLQSLGLKIGHEVELSVMDRTLIVRPVQEGERTELVRRAADHIFERRERVLTRLSEGEEASGAQE